MASYIGEDKRLQFLFYMVSNLAPDYDNTKTYVVGEYAIHQGILYKCETAINIPENFDPTKWSQVIVMDEIGSGGGGTTVIANPQGQATDTLNKLQVGSVIYTIPSGGSGGEIYSLSEVVIGEWLGKTLYRRVFDFGSDVGVPHDNFINTSINASNMQTLVYAKGIFSTGETVYNLMANKGNGVVRLQSDRYNGGANVRFLILEYTKITD